MNYKSIYAKFSCLILVLFTLALVSGCSGGGGSGSNLLAGSSDSGSGSGSDSDSGSGSDSDSGSGDDTSPLVTVHHPEPSSMILLTSGLIGLAFAARRREKNKRKI